MGLALIDTITLQLMGKHVYVHMYIIADVMYTSTVCTQYPASACTYMYIYSDV